MHYVDVLKAQIEVFTTELKKDMDANPRAWDEHGTGTNMGCILMSLLECLRARLHEEEAGFKRWRAEDDNIVLRFPARSVYPGELQEALEKKDLRWVKVYTQDLMGFLPTQAVFISFSRARSKDVDEWNKIWDVIEEFTK